MWIIVLRCKVTQWIVVPEDSDTIVDKSDTVDNQDSVFAMFYFRETYLHYCMYSCIIACVVQLGKQ